MRRQAIVIDSRVRLAWSILIDPEGAKDLTPRRYERMCIRAADWRTAMSWCRMSWKKACSYLAKRVGDYERWTTALLTEVSVPPATAVLGRLTADQHRPNRS